MTLAKFYAIIIQWAIEPIVEIKDARRAFVSRWLATVFIVVLPIGVGVSIVPDLIADSQSMIQKGETISILITLTILFGCYLLFRIDQYEISMIIATIVASILIVSINGDDLDDLIFLLMPIIVLSVLLPKQIVIAVILIDVVLWLTIAFSRDIELGTSFTSFLLGSILTIFITLHRDIIEKYNTQNLRKLNQSLESEILEKSEIQQELQDSLAEKETLLKEIHHRVKNNLQIISSLLRLQSRQFEEHDLSQALVDCQNRVQAMAVVHERLYRSDNLSHILADGYIYEFLKHLVQTQPQTMQTIELDMDIEALPLHIDVAIPCGLLINELVANVYKHAFVERQSGSVQITFSLQDDQYSLNVKDNGRGVPDGFSLEQTRSMGLQLVKTLVRQLKGTVEIFNDDGTSVQIMFPIHDVSVGV